jgi:hypothetical protein
VAENPNEKLVRDFQDQITGGCYDGVYSLDEKSLDRVMECQADACVRAYVQLFDISDDLDLDAFLEKMRMGGSSKIGIRRENDTILLEEFHGGQCVCPLVTRKVIPLEPGLCRCAVHWLRKLFERRVKGPVHVELVGSAALGDENCTFRVTIGDPSPPSAPRDR